ncbi:MAG: hypothetical protein EOO15_04180 [Chitinophagaceae bacterium]|nr:MAG: hypothetical protein EOO15_04180 [Chitinophagaceae bacterium]
MRRNAMTERSASKASLPREGQAASRAATGNSSRRSDHFRFMTQSTPIRAESCCQRPVFTTVYIVFTSGLRLSVPVASTLTGQKYSAMAPLLLTPFRSFGSIATRLLLIFSSTLPALGCQEPMAAVPHPPLGDSVRVSMSLPFGIAPARRPDTLTVDAPISAVYHDRRGFFWIATEGDGLLRYDGKRLETYGTGAGLGSDYISSIGEDSKGRLLFGTRRGVSYYDNGTFGSYAPQPLSALLQAPFHFGSENLWFTAPGGAYGYDGNGIHYFSLPGSDRYCPSAPGTVVRNDETYTVLSVLRDGEGRVWLGTQGQGLCRYDGKNYRWIRPPQIAGTSIRAMAAGADGTLWIGTGAKGIFRYDGKELKSFADITCVAPNVLQSVTALAEGANGTLWIGTRDKGLWRFDGRKLEHFSNDAELQSLNIHFLSRDKKGTIWVGTDNGGLYFYNGKEFQKFRMGGC